MEMSPGDILFFHANMLHRSDQNRSDNPERWVPGSVLFDATGRTYTVRSARPHGERLLVTFEEIGDRTAAEGVAGTPLGLPGKK